VTLALFVACGQEEPVDADAWADEVGPLFEERCVFCHSPTAAASDAADFLTCACTLDMSGTLPDDLLGAPSSQSPDMALVQPGDHLYSYLWHKLNGTQAIAEGSGTSMPLGPALTDEEVDAVAAWIDALDD
jgi:mono/diheme cytochrome c family protein